MTTIDKDKLTKWLVANRPLDHTKQRLIRSDDLLDAIESGELNSEQPPGTHDEHGSGGLKPCPFCGETFRLRGLYLSDWCGLFAIKCPRCGLIGPERSNDYAAIIAWNKRYDDDEH